MQKWLLLLTFLGAFDIAFAQAPNLVRREHSDIPAGLSAAGHDSRIDLAWNVPGDSDVEGFFIYRSESQNGPFARLNAAPHPDPVYSDFFGRNNQTYYYYLTAVGANLNESAPSDTAAATSHAMSTEELLTSVQEATFRYFYDYGHPVSGMARERLNSGDVCASGGTGFGLMALIAGAERGFVTRQAAAARTLKIIRFLQNNAIRYHGAWAHWINGSTGQTIPFSQYDNGGDLVETSYLVQGLLTVRQYYTGSDSVETEIRARATQLWEEVEWDWYRRYPNGTSLYWHWSPNYGWQMNMQIRGYNEAMIVYLLAVASPTHPVPPSCYHIGWARTGAYPYLNGKTFYGFTQWVGPDYGGPLFFTHYSFLGFDPRDKADGYTNYFDNSRNIALIHHAYSIDNPLGHSGYDSLCWGLTASDDPWGYSAHAPYNIWGVDNGTITPSAALSSMPYTPDESIAAMEYFYYTLGASLWGQYGFKDAFNLNQNWFAGSYIAIDQGPIIVMIENYRSQLLWNLFMSNPEIPGMMAALGFSSTGIDPQEGSIPGRLELQQNYPNPFNGETVIRFRLPKSGKITLEIFNTLGQKVQQIYGEKFLAAGEQEARFTAGNLPSGIYYYRLRSRESAITRKMLLLR